jgi:anaerobic ribonucleoside-triphosphate reductase
MMNVKVIKRSGELVDFDGSKITAAIAKAGKAAGEFDHKVASVLTTKVVEKLESDSDEAVTVETIQDIGRRHFVRNAI